MNQVFAQQNLHGLNGLNVQAGNVGNFLIINSVDIVFCVVNMGDIGGGGDDETHRC